MRKLVVFTAICLFACSMFVTVQTSAAALYEGAWRPNSADTFSITLDNSNGSGSFGFYDWGNPSQSMEVISDISAFGVGVVYFNNQGANGTYQMSLDQVVWTNLGISDDFGIYFGSNSNPIYLYDVENIDSAGNDVYRLTASGASVILHDANPVPVPAAVFLLGSGLMGLVGFRRKTQK